MKQNKFVFSKLPQIQTASLLIAIIHLCVLNAIQVTRFHQKQTNASFIKIFVKQETNRGNVCHALLATNLLITYVWFLLLKVQKLKINFYLLKVVTLQRPQTQNCAINVYGGT